MSDCFDGRLPVIEVCPSIQNSPHDLRPQYNTLRYFKFHLTLFRNITLITLLQIQWKKNHTDSDIFCFWTVAITLCYYIDLLDA